MCRDPIHTIGGTSSRSTCIACVMLDQCCVHHNQELMLNFRGLDMGFGCLKKGSNTTNENVSDFHNRDRFLWGGPGMIGPILKPILEGLRQYFVQPL